MATESTLSTDSVTHRPTWQTGVLAGVLGGLVFGAVISQLMTPTITKAIPALYGLSGGLAGWVVHVSHAAVLGVGFAALADGADTSLGRTVLLGGVYGVVLWAVLAAIVMPVWLDAVGFPGAPAVPNVNAKSLVGHVVYGVVTGGAFAALSGT